MDADVGYGRALAGRPRTSGRGEPSSSDWSELPHAGPAKRGIKLRQGGGIAPVPADPHQLLAHGRAAHTTHPLCDSVTTQHRNERCALSSSASHDFGDLAVQAPARLAGTVPLPARLPARLPACQGACLHSREQPARTAAP
jgi:hypothetical protein